MAATAVTPTPAERAAFAREAASVRDAGGIGVLGDLAKAYKSGKAPVPQRQRLLYAMLRQLERAGCYK